MAGIAEWVAEVVDALGALGVMLLIALESVFPPIPSEVVLGSAGFVAGRGDASLSLMVAAATTGSVIGALLLYGLGAWIGDERLRSLVERHGRWLRVGVSDLDRAETWFDRHATLAVLGGRCVPLVRSLVSLPAGVRRMPLGRFTALTTLGSLVWNTCIISAGFLLGENWVVVEKALEVGQFVVLALVTVLAVRYLLRRSSRPGIELEPEAAQG